MTFQKTNCDINVTDKKQEKQNNQELNISALCKFLIFGLFMTLIVVGVSFMFKPTVYLVTGQTSTVVETIKQGSEGVQSSQILSLIGMILPLCFVVLFSVSILKSKKSKINLSFVLPVVALSVFCFIMAIIQMSAGNGQHCIVYLIFEVFAMFTLLVFNLIENRSKLNVKGAMRKMGILGACLAIIALSFTSAFYKRETVEKDKNEIEYVQKQD